MIELVTYENTKSRLSTAQNLIQQNKIGEALQEIALAFAYLIHDYEQKKHTQFKKSPFFFGQNLTFETSFFMGVEGKNEKFCRQSKGVD